MVSLTNLRPSPLLLVRGILVANRRLRFCLGFACCCTIDTSLVDVNGATIVTRPANELVVGQVEIADVMVHVPALVVIDGVGSLDGPAPAEPNDVIVQVDLQIA